MRSRISAVAAAVLASLFLARSGAVEQAPRRADADWPMFRHDDAGTGHSPLAQITTGNAAKLSRVWTYSLQSTAPAPTTGKVKERLRRR